MMRVSEDAGLRTEKPMSEENKKEPQGQENQKLETQEQEASLSEQDLGKVSGGSLYQSCCTGKHIPGGMITV
jgi:hypothetical protein